MLNESLSAAIAQGTQGNVVDGIESLARLAALTGQAKQAVGLFGTADAMRETLEFRRSPTDIAYVEPVIRQLRETLGGGFAEEWERGRSRPLQEAIDEALALRVVAQDATPATRQRAATHGLSEREREVLRLIAAGHTTREIGEALFISPATAAKHIANIYAKLDVDSRAKAATFAHQHGLA